MTRHEVMLAGVLLDQFGDASPEKIVERLIELGLINRRACEQRAVRREVDRLWGEGVARCEAMYVVADMLCCSYEKVRGMYYNKL